MEKATKFVVETTKNPRGKSLTLDDIRQCILDISTYLTKTIGFKPTLGVPEADLLSLKTKAKFLPEALEEFLRKHNGGVQLLESYRTLSAKEIIDSLEEYKIYGFWNNEYLPVAKDSEGSLLILQVDRENKLEKGIVTWSRDSGVLEEVSENLGLYLEGYSTGLLKKKYEFVEGAGMIENS